MQRDVAREKLSDLLETHLCDVDDTEDDDTETLPCPECGADIYEDADQCPVCGMFVVHSTRVWTGKSAWWIALALLGVLAVILTLTLGR